MTVLHAPLTLVLLFGMAESAMLGVALLGRRPPSAAAGWLGALLLVVALALAVPVMHALGLWPRWPRSVITLSGLPLLFGPLLLAHVAHQVGQVRWLRGGWLGLHAVLPGLFALLALWLALQDGSELVRLLSDETRSQQPGLIPVLKHLSFLGYSTASLMLMRGYEGRLRQHLAEIQPYSLTWLRALVWSALSVAMALLTTRWWPMSPEQIDLALSVVVSALVLIAGFHGLRQPRLFDPLPALGAEQALASEAAPAAMLEPVPAPITSSIGPEDDRRSSKPPLDPVELKRWLPRLRALSGDETLLFDHSLDLNRLAKAMGLTPNQLSFALNAGLGRSFYEFVNGLRVAAVQKRLADPEQKGVPILDLALGCGFSNKSTFNKCFKEVTGQTPSAWRRAAGPTGSAGRGTG
ncbi:MAG TPA: helix-turn-helix domain-containing protein [Arenimonas sp.]|nr:helix-turn-helix domain-containing protein [Arenimonas sp.]